MGFSSWVGFNFIPLHTVEIRFGFRRFSPSGTKRQDSDVSHPILCGPGKAAILPCKIGLDVGVPADFKLALPIIIPYYPANFHEFFPKIPRFSALLPILPGCFDKGTAGSL
ncbi:MAG TPA: hypothetical protein IAD19_03885 [Candidatus Egerieicola faecale]|uniref:Uncharacterized protein n=1 Tax=Candidatus Egerieicola faecale TaxID=2840774 RepID=A0A9D1IQY6_9FIRM|nr:hypothetical protein [Candidatus Egerieicola faecale]